MSKATTRINKFIFHDAFFFLRLKTVAKNLKIKKNDTGYVMELLTYVPKRLLTQVQVVLCENFDQEAFIHKDALELGYGKDKSGTISTATVGAIEEVWGDRLTLRTPDKHATYYYLHPTEQNFAVKVGPIFKSIDDRELEIDWANLQWGNT